MPHSGPRFAALFLALIPSFAFAQTPQTVAESSDYKATAKHADVVAFCEQLARIAPEAVRLGQLGLSHEKRAMPLLILADPPLSTPEEAAASGKLVVFAQGNIHAGEVDGKEALLMLAREIALAKDRPLLKQLIFVVAPIVNPDGNDRFSKDHRPDQNGPLEVGQRANAQDLDLNRDFIKLDTPEVRAMVRFYRLWNPGVVIDTHTTNGSHHRYPLTFDGPRHPAIPEKMISYVRDAMFPDVASRLEKKTGFPSFFYGNFNGGHTQWEAYPALPRYGTQYLGLRGRIAILSESYSYAPYRDRVRASREFVRACLEFLAEHRDEVKKLLDDAEKPPAEIAIAHQLVARPQPAIVRGFVEADGKPDLNQPKNYTVTHVDLARATASVPRCVAYLIPPNLPGVADLLQRHGIIVEELREDIELPVETREVLKVIPAAKPYQGHTLNKLETAAPKQTVMRFPAGTFVVRTSQSLGRLAAFLLEADSEDGLALWGMLDGLLKPGQPYPIARLATDVPVTAGRIRPLAEERVTGKRIKPEHFLGTATLPNLNGSPVRDLQWLPDGEHFLQTKQGQIRKVHAATGRVEAFLDRGKLVSALAAGLKIAPAQAAQIPFSRGTKANPQQTGFVFTHKDDLYFAAFDGSRVTRLTSSAAPNELATFSPDGQWVAFVRNQDLYTVDLATQKERRLTGDGGGKISNGKADWVYYEELFDRNSHAFWWSPDSRSLAFLRFDDTPVAPFPVVDLLTTHPKLEQTPYPKAGYPNPLVHLGVVSADGGPVRFVETPSSKPEDTLLVRAAWTPDSREILFYLADRAQTWLDVMSARLSASIAAPLTVKTFFRETTKAWVDDPGDPLFLKDGSFLFHSERDGWKHLYHYARDGKLIRRVTEGPWEVRHVHLVDEKGGSVYFSATADSPIAQNLYRVALNEAGQLTPLTRGGDHRVNFSPTGSYFIDTASSHAAATTVTLRRLDGRAERRIDTNPVYAIEEYKLGKEELVKVPLPDGFVLEGSVLLPVDFDAKQKYPVWFMTYGGPHAPTISDTWAFHTLDHVLSSLGIIVFRCDPRSASGKGAVSTWTAYRQLGVQEAKDVDAAIDWLARTYPCVDVSKVGMSGSSYGGFLTAYCLTHSKKFAAGVAGAPVTDWNLYDSIYTERYMNTPKENPAGYAKTSVIRAAKDLHGKLLIIHGLMDDNVHVQNSVKLIEELERANRDYELVVYPQARHGFGGPYGRHYQRTMLEFVRKTMGK